MSKSLSIILLSALALAACSRAPDAQQPAKPVAQSSHIPSQAAIDKSVAEGPESALRQLRPLDYWLHYKVMQATGIEKELGGEAQAVAALKAIGNAYERKLHGLQAEAPKMIPAAFSGEGMTSGVVGLGMGAGLGYMTGGLATQAASGMSDAQLAELRAKGPIKAGGKDGRTELTFDESGGVDQTMQLEVDEEGLSGKIKTRIRMDACPDPQGKVTVKIDVDSQMSVKGKSGTGGYVRAQFVYERYLDDDAHPISTDDGGASNLRLQMGGLENHQGQHVDITTGHGRDGNTTFENRAEKGFSIFRLSEVERTKELIRGAEQTLSMIAEIMLRGIGSSSAPWESGRCVKLEPTTDPIKRKGTDPRTRFEIVAAPRAKADDAPTGGTVRATLSGGENLTRDDEKVGADAQYTYIAPTKKNQVASIEFEARSKRGVGKTTLEFDTKATQAYRFTVFPGCGAVEAPGEICDLARPFSMKGTGANCGGIHSSMHFKPSDNAEGTLEWTTRVGAISANFNGSYTVEETKNGAVLQTRLTGCAMGPGAKSCGGTGPSIPLVKIDACAE